MNARARDFMPPAALRVRLLATREEIEIPCDETVFNPPAHIAAKGAGAGGMDATMSIPTTLKPRRACDAGPKGTRVMVPREERYELAEVID